MSQFLGDGAGQGKSQSGKPDNDICGEDRQLLRKAGCQCINHGENRLVDD
jgi:hypothetical protein